MPGLPSSWSKSAGRIKVGWTTIIRFMTCLCQSDTQSLYRFLCTLFLAANANFKLKEKDHGIHNLELALGWALFVEERCCQEHIGQYVD
jgi:hypothetical protein